MSSASRRFAALRFFLGAVVGSCLCFATLRGSPWQLVESDLPPHPELKQGTLPNGLRYAILPNAEAKDRISLRLVVGVGSLHENDDELGLAHFVEHMVFRGTRTHPAGSLTAALQRLGVGVGPDSAAFTFYDHTAYHLELPDASDRTLREGLRALREFAEEVTFDERLIERERGVILSEMATRDTPTARSGAANQAFLWPGSRHARRPIAGVPVTIRAFNRAQFVSFYDAWYRPERMAIVVVGNVDPARMTPIVEELLGKFVARGAPRPEPADITPLAASAPDVALFSDPGLVGVLLTLQRPFATPLQPDTHTRRVALLHQALAFAMFHQRLQKITHDPGASFLGPMAGVSSPMRGWQLAELTVSGSIKGWTLVSAEVEREHRRAFQFGFTASELADAKAGFVASYEQSVRTCVTWPSNWVADRLAACLVSGTVFAHPSEAVEAIIIQNGFKRLFYQRTLIWQVVVYIR